MNVRPIALSVALLFPLLPALPAQDEGSAPTTTIELSPTTESPPSSAAGSKNATDSPTSSADGASTEADASPAPSPSGGPDETVASSPDSGTDLSAIVDAIDALSGKVDEMAGKLSDTDAKVDSLGTKVDAIQAGSSAAAAPADLSGLSTDIKSLSDKVDGLAAQLSDTDSKIAAAQTASASATPASVDLSGITALVSSLSDKVGALSAQLSATDAKVDSVKALVKASGGGTVSTASGTVDLSAITDDLEALKAKIDALASASSETGAKLSALSGQVADVGGKVDAVGGKVDAVGGKVDAVGKQIGALGDEILLKLDSLGAVSTKLRSVESDYLASDSLGSWKKLDTSAFKTKLASGFAGGDARVGTWVQDKAGTSIAQKDGKAYFAKWRLAVPQAGDKPVLYSFTAGSSSKDVVGMGIHLFVSGMPDKAKDKAYWGEGKSVLVWFARDPAVKGNRLSWLQIYKSDSEVDLTRVFDSQMEDAFTDMDNMKVDILYDPSDRLIVVQVNGTIRVAYRLPFALPAGSEIALRTVGSGCTFSGFSVSGQ